MHSHLKGVLDSFASHLKIRRREGDVNEIAQKYLALGCNVVPTQHVYDAVSSDYELLKLKTTNPPLSDYAHEKRAPVDPTLFVQIVKNGFPSPPMGGKETTLLHEFNHFVESVVLTPVGKDESPEKWIEACRKDKWKDVALFLSLNYKENPRFHTLLKNIVGEDSVEVLRKRMLAYKVFDKKGLARDMGSLIKSIRLSNEFVESIISAPLVEEPLETSVVVVPFVQQSLMIESSKDSLKKEEDIVLTPIMDAYRKRAGLPAIVDPKRIAKQMIAALLVSCGNQVAPDSLLLRSQTKLEPLNSEEERDMASEFIHSNLISSEALQKALKNSARAQQIAFACNQKKWDDRTLLAHVVDPKGHMDERTFAKWSKMTKNTTGEEDFLKTLFC
jgi:hypothetical protein